MLSLEIWKDFKLFNKVSEKFNLVKNWAVLGELMILPVDTYNI